MTSSNEVARVFNSSDLPHLSHQPFEFSAYFDYNMAWYMVYYLQPTLFTDQLVQICIYIRYCIGVHLLLIALS